MKFIKNKEISRKIQLISLNLATQKKYNPTRILNQINGKEEESLEGTWYDFNCTIS